MQLPTQPDLNALLARPATSSAASSAASSVAGDAADEDARPDADGPWCGTLEDASINQFVGNSPWLPYESVAPCNGLAAHAVWVLNVPIDAFYPAAESFADLRFQSSSACNSHERSCLQVARYLLMLATMLTGEVTERNTENGAHMQQKIQAKESMGALGMNMPISRFFTFIDESTGNPHPMFSFFLETLVSESGDVAGRRLWKVVHDRHHSLRRGLSREMNYSAKIATLLRPESYGAKSIPEKERLKAKEERKEKERGNPFRQFLDVISEEQLRRCMQGVGAHPPYLRPSDGVLDPDQGDPTHPLDPNTVLNPLSADHDEGGWNPLVAGIATDAWAVQVCEAQRNMENYFERNEREDCPERPPAKFRPKRGVLPHILMLGPQDFDPLTTPFPPALPDAGLPTKHIRNMFKDLIRYSDAVGGGFLPPSPQDLDKPSHQARLDRSILLYMGASADGTVVRDTSAENEGTMQSSSYYHRKEIKSYLHRRAEAGMENARLDGQFSVGQVNPIERLRKSNARVDEMYDAWMQCVLDGKVDTSEATQITYAQSKIMFQLVALQRCLVADRDALPPPIRNHLDRFEEQLKSTSHGSPACIQRPLGYYEAEHICRTAFSHMNASDIGLWSAWNFTVTDAASSLECISQTLQQLQDCNEGAYCLCLVGERGSGKSAMLKILHQCCTPGIVDFAGSASACVGKNGMNPHDRGCKIFDEAHPGQHVRNMEELEKWKEVASRRELNHVRTVDRPDDMPMSAIAHGGKVEANIVTPWHHSEIALTNGRLTNTGEGIAGPDHMDAMYDRKKVLAWAGVSSTNALWAADNEPRRHGGSKKRACREESAETNLQDVLKSNPGYRGRLMSFRVRHGLAMILNLCCESITAFEIPMQHANATMKKMDVLMLRLFRVDMPGERDIQRRQSALRERVVRSACNAVFMGDAACRHTELWEDDARVRALPFRFEHLALARPYLIPTLEIIYNVYFLDMRFRQIPVMDNVMLSIAKSCGFFAHDLTRFYYKEAHSVTPTPQHVSSLLAVQPAQQAGERIKMRCDMLRAFRNHERDRLVNPDVTIDIRFGLSAVRQWYGEQDALARAIGKPTALSPAQWLKPQGLNMLLDGNDLNPNRCCCYRIELKARPSDRCMIEDIAKELKRDDALSKIGWCTSTLEDCVYLLCKRTWERHAVQVGKSLVHTAVSNADASSGGRGQISMGNYPIPEELLSGWTEKRFYLSEEQLTAILEQAVTSATDSTRRDGHRNVPYPMLVANYNDGQRETESVVECSRRSGISSNAALYAPSFSVAALTFACSLGAEARLHMLDCCRNHHPTILRTFGLHSHEDQPDPRPQATDDRDDGLPFSPTIMTTYRLLVCMAQMEKTYVPAKCQGHTPRFCLPEMAITTETTFLEYEPNTTTEETELIRFARKHMQKHSFCLVSEEEEQLGANLALGTRSDALASFVEYANGYDQLRQEMEL